MRIKAVIALSFLTLLAGGSALWLHADEPRRRYPRPTPPPPPSPIYTPAPEEAPNAAQIARDARDHDAALVRFVERALATRDPQDREAAFTFVLPELIQVAPERVAAMFARQERGEPRDVLRDEIACQWITRDRDAAIRWIRSLDDAAERRAAASAAVRVLAPVAPGQAIYVAAQFDVGDVPRFQGSVEGEDKE